MAAVEVTAVFFIVCDLVHIVPDFDHSYCKPGNPHVIMMFKGMS